MLRQSIPTALICLASAATVACATAGPPPSPAALSFEGANCAPAPDLSSALSLTPDKERAVFSVNAPVTAASGCLARDGAEVPYVVFALPADQDDKTLIAGGTLEPLRILSPAVTVLDGSGRATRTFAAEDYMYRGPIFSVQFRPRADERYVMVAADASRVGQQYDSIAVGVTTTQVYTPYGAASFNSGTDVAQRRTFSFEGLATVLINDGDTREAED